MPKQKTIKTPKLTRAATITRLHSDGEGENDRTIDLSFSSEDPVTRWFGDEILDHGKSSVDLDWFRGGTAPLLLDHDPEKQIGVIESASIGGDLRGRATVRFGKNSLAEETLADVRDGIRANISVGYRINRMVLEETGDDVGSDIYRAVDWGPLEISIVSVPADMTVGIGRDGDAQPEFETIIEGIKKMPEQNTTPETGTRGAVAPVPAQPKIDEAAVRDAIQKKELSRINEITAMGQRHGMVDDANRAISQNVTLDDFRIQVLDKVAERSPADIKRAEEPEIGLTAKEADSFSFVRALNAIANPNDRRAQEAAGFEHECSVAAGKRMGKTAQGIMVPVDVMKRDLNVGTTTAGGNLVATDLLPGSFIDLLRNAMVMDQVGATLLTDLNGNIAIPKQTGGATSYWIGTEGGSPTESQQTIGQVALSPKTLGAFTDYTRQLLMQSSISIENFVRMDLSRVIALAIDLASLYGTGSSGQPTGVSQTTGINTTTFAGADPTFGEVVAMETAVSVDNADVGNLSYVTDAAMRGAFKTTEKASGTAQFIWEPGNTVNGYNCPISNQVRW